jgi:mRNA-degrading endonuclease toxin of MazEF toxin-antitoxin module
MVPVTGEGRPSAAAVDQRRAVTKERFLRKVESIGAEQLEAVEGGLRAILGW